MTTVEVTGPGHNLAAGATVVVRDEEWLVRVAFPTTRDGMRIEVRGTSELVRDQTDTFFAALDEVEVLDRAKPCPRRATRSATTAATSSPSTPSRTPWATATTPTGTPSPRRTPDDQRFPGHSTANDACSPRPCRG